MFYTTNDVCTFGAKRIESNPTMKGIGPEEGFGIKVWKKTKAGETERVRVFMSVMGLHKLLDTTVHVGIT
jgi:hypothetical protein